MAHLDLAPPAAEPRDPVAPKPNLRTRAKRSAARRRTTKPRYPNSPRHGSKPRARVLRPAGGTRHTPTAATAAERTPRTARPAAAIDPGRTARALAVQRRWGQQSGDQKQQRDHQQRERRRHREQDVRHGRPERDLAHIGVRPRVELRVPEDGMAGDHRGNQDDLEVVHIELPLRWPTVQPRNRAPQATREPNLQPGSPRIQRSAFRYLSPGPKVPRDGSIHWNRIPVSLSETSHSRWATCSSSAPCAGRTRVGLPCTCPGPFGP